MTTDQLGGLLRALSPFLVLILVGWGMDSDTAALVAGAVTAVVMALWAWWSHRPASMAKSVAAQPGVQVVVAPNAAPALKQLAADPAVPTVVPSAPNGGL